MKKTIALCITCILFVALHAQWIKDSLVTPRTAIPISAYGVKILFGCTNGNFWDVFDTKTKLHTSGTLSASRTDIVFTRNGSKSYFAGGKYGPFTDPLFVKNIDVYDASSNSWSLVNLSLARIVGGAGSVGTKVLFAGGQGRDFGGPMYIYNRVDIFDVISGLRTTAKLSKARVNIAVGTAANKIVFAGGWFWDMSYNHVQSNVADIYDNTTGVWSKSFLSNKREEIGVGAVGNKILFAGGYSYANGFTTYRNVDIYDAVNNTWNTTYLSIPRYGMAIAVVGSKVYFAGGAASNTIDVYDVSNSTWSFLTMPLFLRSFGAAVVGTTIYYAGGVDSLDRLSDAVQVLNTTNNSWRIDRLSQPRYGVSSLGYNNMAIFAGGYRDPYNSATPSNRIDIYLQPKLNAFVVSSTNVQKQKINFTVSPNPVSDHIQLVASGFGAGKKELSVMDAEGRILLRYSFLSGEFHDIIPVFFLKPGIYFCKIVTPDNVYTVKFIKE